MQELSPDQQLVVETLLGRRIRSGEAIRLGICESPEVEDHRRRESGERLLRLFGEMDDDNASLSPSEMDDIVTEAMRTTRPGFRLHR